MSELLEFVDSLPSIDLPQVFGLHLNADLTFFTKKAQYIIDTIVNLEPYRNLLTSLKQFDRNLESSSGAESKKKVNTYF